MAPASAQYLASASVASATILLHLFLLLSPSPSVPSAPSASYVWGGGIPIGTSAFLSVRRPLAIRTGTTKLMNTTTMMTTATMTTTGTIRRNRYIPPSYHPYVFLLPPILLSLSLSSSKGGDKYYPNNDNKDRVESRRRISEGRAITGAVDSTARINPDDAGGRG